MRRASPVVAGVLLATLCACGGGGGGTPSSGPGNLTGRWFLTQSASGIAGDPRHLTVTQTGAALSAEATCDGTWPVGTGTWNGTAFSLSFDFGGGNVLSLVGAASGNDITGTSSWSGGAGTFTLVRTEVSPLCAEGCDPLAITPFVDMTFTDLEKIAQISKFRSSIDADASDICEHCRNMSHSFAPSASHQVNGDIALYAPVDGQITSVSAETHGASAGTTNKRVEIKGSSLFHVGSFDYDVVSTGRSYVRRPPIR